MEKYTYAGIGSRETPETILTLMKMIARHAALANITLRSGGAGGADLAFEEGCDSANGEKEIYIPWKGFNGSTSNLYNIHPLAFDYVKKYHPNPSALSQGALKLHARNTSQILGKDLNSKSTFVVCYTKGGKGQGGTGQALRIAKDNNIPIFDLGLYENDIELLKDKYRDFLKTLDLK